MKLFKKKVKRGVLPLFALFNSTKVSACKKPIQKIAASNGKENRLSPPNTGSDGSDPKKPGFDFYKQGIFFERASKSSVILGLTVPFLAASGYCDTIRVSRLSYRTVAKITIRQFPIQFLVKAGQVWISQASNDVVSSWSPRTTTMNQTITLGVSGMLCQTLLYNNIIRSVEEAVQERSGIFQERKKSVVSWDSIKNNLRRSYAGGTASLLRECGSIGAGTVVLAPLLRAKYENLGMNGRISKPVAGISAGICAAALTQPLHVIAWLKSQSFLQTEAASLKTEKTLAPKSYRKIIREVKFREMFSGLTSRVKIIPAVVVVLYINEVNQPLPKRYE
nr:hypothetical protein [Endozoicomonas sp.]